MQIQVMMVVYDRWRNADRWRRLWNAMPRQNESLTIVHNIDGAMLRVTSHEPILEIERPNIGMDLGAAQDAVRGRLPLPEWDWLFVVPDDFLPMLVDFLPFYRELAAESNVGLVASRINHPPEVDFHIRTGAFMIRRDVAERLNWGADPITTKDQCHDFESRHLSIMKQVEAMGVEWRVLPDDVRGVMWDTHHEGSENRLRDFPCRDVCDLFHFWGTDKSSHHSYCDVYNVLCEPFRQTTNAILEIGVHTGASLRAWRDYFPLAQVHGIDINPAATVVGEDRITTHHIDMRDPVALSSMAAAHGPFQLVVDDGSHVTADMLLAYGVLGSFLTDDGLYVIEDVPDQAGLDVFRRMPDATCFDRREIKGRYDDIMIVLNKGRRKLDWKVPE